MTFEIGNGEPETADQPEYVDHLDDANYCTQCGSPILGTIPKMRLASALAHGEEWAVRMASEETSFCDDPQTMHFHDTTDQ